MIIASLTVSVPMVVVSTVVMIVVGVVVVKVSVWDVTISNMVVVTVVLVIGVLVGVEFIEVGVAVIILKFALPVSYSVDMSSDVAVGLFMDVLTGVIICALDRIDIELLADAFAVSVSTPLEEFSR